MDKLVGNLNIEAAAGISGWSPQLIKLCYGTPEKATPFREFLCKLAGQMLMGTAKGRDMLTTSRLTPLQQNPTKVRPVACGELFYRIGMRLILQVKGTKGTLLPQQLGVGSPGGVEPIVELLQQQVMREAADSQYVYQLDMSNAFNSTSRKVISEAVRQYAPEYYRLAKWAYNDASPLTVSGQDRTEILWSREGVRQGCPLGPYLFSLALRTTLTRLQTTVAPNPGEFVTSFLDDIFVISDKGDQHGAIVDFFEEERGAGFHLNAEKTKVYNMADVRQGVHVLGAVVGDVEARRGFLRDKIEELRPTLHRLQQIPRQQALLLLRLSLAPQLRHLLRTMDLSDLEPELKDLDQMIYSALDALRAAPPHPPEAERTQRIYSLPLKWGGLGVFSYTEIRPLARKACQEAAWTMLDTMKAPNVIIPPPDPLPSPEEEEAQRGIQTQTELTKAYFRKVAPAFIKTLAADDAAAFLDNGSKGGTAWLHATPWGTGYRSLTDAQVAGALNIRVLMPDVCGRSLCARCGGTNGILHFESCPAVQLPGQYRHNYIRDVLAKAIRRTQRIVQVEPLVSQSNNRRADLSISSVEGPHNLDAEYGMVDLKVRGILTGTARGMPVGITMPALEGDQESEDEGHEQEGAQKRAYGRIGQALDQRYRETLAQYSSHHASRPVVPLVISSGGSMHKEADKFLRAMFPSGIERWNILMDISIALIRARGQVYHLA